MRKFAWLPRMEAVCLRPSAWPLRRSLRERLSASRRAWRAIVWAVTDGADISCGLVCFRDGPGL